MSRANSNWPKIKNEGSCYKRRKKHGCEADFAQDYDPPRFE